MMYTENMPTPVENSVNGTDYLDQWFPIFLTPGIGFVGGNFSMDWDRGEGFRMIGTHYLYHLSLCILLLLLYRNH